MKKKRFHIFTIIFVIIIILAIILGFIWYDLNKVIEEPIDLGDTKLKEIITVGNHSMSRITSAYNLKQTENEIILTIYQHTSPVKSVTHHIFENDKLVDLYTEIHYSTKLEAIFYSDKENFENYKRKGNVVSGRLKNVTLDYTDTKETLYEKLDGYSEIFIKLDDNSNIVN